MTKQEELEKDRKYVEEMTKRYPVLFRVLLDEYTPTEKDDKEIEQIPDEDFDELLYMLDEMEWLEYEIFEDLWKDDLHNSQRLSEKTIDPKQKEIEALWKRSLRHR